MTGGRVYVLSQCTVRRALTLASFILDLWNGGWRLPLQYGKAFSPILKMQTQVPFKMTVLLKGSKPSFFCFRFPFLKWDRGSACDVTTNKSIQLNINFQSQQIMCVIIIQGFRSTSKRGPQERPHIGQLNSFVWFCWNHLNTFADLINTLCSCWLDSVFTTGAIYLWNAWWLPIRLRERHIFR